MPTFRKDIKLGTKVPLIKTDDLSDKAITTDKLADGSVTNPKLAPESVTQDKFDKELLAIFKAAANLPEDLIQTIQDVDVTLKDHQQQITSNDEDISDLQTKVKQNKDTIDGIAVSGGASVASAVTYDNTTSGLESENIQNAIDELVNNLGHYETNEEWLRLYLDKEGHILWGIRVDGSIEWSVGIPTPIQKKLNELISSDDTIKQTIAELKEYTNQQLATKVDKEEGKSLIDDEVKDCFKIVENDEFIHCIQDAEDHILFAIRRDTGKPYFPLNEMYHVEQNEEYLALWLDSADHILMGIRRDGVIVGEINACNVLKKVIANIQSDVSELQSIEPSLKELLNTFTFQENEEYLAIETDAEGKILASTNTDGSHYAYNIKSETIAEEFRHMNDPEDRMEATIDNDGKLLSYRDKEGNLHERKIFADCIKLSSSGMTEFQKALVDSGFINGLGDWSNNTSLQIDEPSCALINITSSDGKPAEWAASKTDNKKYWMQFYDKNGNYFKKRIIFNIQGNSSALFEKKNGAIDICNDEWVGDDTFSLKIGKWVSQDSFHLKAYYFDFFKCAGTVSYKIVDEVDRTRPFYENKPWKKAFVNKIYRDTSVVGNPNKDIEPASLSVQFDNGARCVPDGFPCIVFLDGSFYGIYAFCLKKHRDNYMLDKSIETNIHLDGDLNQNSLFNGVISWSSFEIRNPKYLVYKTAHGAYTATDKDSVSIAFQYNADVAQDEIAGSEAPAEYSDSIEYSIGDVVKLDNRVFMAISPASGVQPSASKKAKDVFKDAASNGYWIDVTFTNKVRQSIVRLSKAMSDISTSEDQSSKFDEYFDKDNLIDYELVQCALHDTDSQGFNWQLITYDGDKWFFCNYDKERVYGQTGTFNMLEEPPKEGSFIIGSGQGTPNEWIINNCETELKSRWLDLVNCGIFTTEHIIGLYNNWIARVGLENYKKEYDKWKNSPCNRESGIDTTNWQYSFKNIAGWNPWSTWNSSTSYSKGDYIKYGDYIYVAKESNTNKEPSSNNDYWENVSYDNQKTYQKGDIAWVTVNDYYYCFSAKQETCGNNPIMVTYPSYPQVMGYHDNIWRLHSYIETYLKGMNTFINNIK